MNKKVILLTSLMLAVSLTYGYYKTHSNKSEPTAQVSNTINKTSKYYSPYIGEELSKNTYSNAPFMVMIENSKSARPQSGLSEADIVYETMAEGGISRFMALFQKNSPKEIGPVRSIRPYFINIAKEYNLPFVHCGGSEEALNYIKEENLMSMNEMKYSSYFWRDDSRKAPHNLYSSASKIRNLISLKSYISPLKSGLNFDDSYWSTSNLPSASNVSLKLNRSYYTEYNLKNGSYTKSMDGVVAVDRGNNKNIEVKNIVIQIADINLQADGSHLDIDMVGKGTGYIVTEGKYKKINWARKDLSSQTKLTDENGKEVALNPGMTWWHILDNKASIEFH